jgi:hypothetical protein
LGGQKLDLHKIFKLVYQQGGYLNVTNERGWKRIADHFDLSSTCTNSAFVFKHLYKKHLLLYENMQRNNISVDDAVARWVIDQSNFEDGMFVVDYRI